MKIRLTTFIAIAAAFILGGCKKPQQDSVSPERLKALETELAAIKATQGQASPQDKRKGELTRELATELLNTRLAKPAIFELPFDDDGLKRAKGLGVVEPQDGFPPSYRFTEGGLGGINIDGRTFKDFIKQNRIELPLQGTSETPKFVLSTPIAEQVGEVTGIAPTPFGVTTVEYTTKYIFPEEMSWVANFLFIGRRTQSAFRMYDDGWRLIEQ